MAEAASHGSDEPVDLTLTAVGSGREVKLGALNAPALLICFAQETQAGIDPVEAVARGRYADAAELVIAHVVDLHKVPGILRKVAEGILAGEHRKAVEALEPGRDATEYVVVLPDWDGSAVRKLGLEDASKAIGIALVDISGRVAWRYQGPDPAEALRGRLAAYPI